MITIKKMDMKFEFPNGGFVTSQDTPDGMYFKFKDGSELFLNGIEKTPQIKTIPSMLMKTTAKEVTIDFNNPKSLIAFS